MEWKVIIAFLFAIILVSVVSGCTSSNTSENETAPSETTTITTGTDPGFSKLIGMSPLTAYSVTYDVTTNYGGDTQSSTIKQVISGTKMKYDITTANSPARAVTIKTDEKYYVCSLGSGQDMCFEMTTDSTEPNTADQASDTARSFEDTPNVVYDGTKTIAGATTYCYKVTSDGADYKFCLDKNHGMLLGMYSTASGVTTNMEATAFSTTQPSDSEFVPPAPVQTMPSYG